MYSLFFYVITCCLVCFPSFSHLDAPEPWQLSFQDPATPVAQGIQSLHHDIFFILLVILGFVLWMLGRTVFHFNEDVNTIPSKVVHGTVLEIVWTVTPSLILMVIAIPSFALLYSIEEIVDPAMTIKVIGHQWYWTYEYSDFKFAEDYDLVFDSYMIPDDDLELGELRLLEVDYRVILPTRTHIRVILTAADVLHNWGIPSLGMKCDAVPGRLNQASLFIQRQGIFYGQCSELCGVNHGFMPIVVEAVSPDDFLSWVITTLDVKE
jgi:cytochrome c oxidase subunit 2